MFGTQKCIYFGKGSLPAYNTTENKTLLCTSNQANGMVINYSIHGVLNVTTGTEKLDFVNGVKVGIAYKNSLFFCEEKNNVSGMKLSRCK